MVDKIVPLFFCYCQFSQPTIHYSATKCTLSQWKNPFFAQNVCCANLGQDESMAICYHGFYFWKMEWIFLPTMWEMDPICTCSSLQNQMKGNKEKNVKYSFCIQCIAVLYLSYKYQVRDSTMYGSSNIITKLFSFGFAWCSSKVHWAHERKVKEEEEEEEGRASFYRSKNSISASFLLLLPLLWNLFWRKRERRGREQWKIFYPLLLLAIQYTVGTQYSSAHLGRVHCAPKYQLLLDHFDNVLSHKGNTMKQVLLVHYKRTLVTMLLWLSLHQPWHVLAQLFSHTKALLCSAHQKWEEREREWHFFLPLISRVGIFFLFLPPSLLFHTSNTVYAVVQ